MPFALLFIGLILIVSAARGTLPQLGELLKSQFVGPNNFFYWLLAIGVVGAIGYKTKGETFSRTFMALILLSMTLSNKGVFQKFTEAIGSAQATTGGAGTAAGNTVDGGKAPQQAQASGSSSAGAGGKASAVVGQIGKTQADIDKIVSGLNSFMGASGQSPAGALNSVSTAANAVSGGVGGVFSALSKATGFIGKIGGFLGGLF